MTRVLVVDDEPQILRALRINLRAREYDVDLAPDGGRALASAASHPPDLVVLDLGLPDLSGVEVIRRLRSWTHTPIIVLSGRAGMRDKVEALDAGADDYLTKPFGVDELLARIRAVTRRLGPADGDRDVRIGAYAVDVAGRRVQPPVHLTRTEWKILTLLLANAGKLVSQRQLLTEVWGPGHENETQYLRQYLASLRRKLEADPAHPRHLLTEPGMGYRFQPAGT